MFDSGTTSGGAEVPDSASPLFLVLTFGIAWGVFALFFAYPDELTSIFGPPSGSHPLFILAVYAPAFSAMAVVLRHTGVSGLGRFLARLGLVRMPACWWAVLLAGPPLIFAAGAAVEGPAFPIVASFDSTGAAISAVAFMAVLGPVEEIGWRGVALPLLQRRMAPAFAGLFLGLIWGIWHLPAFFLSGTPQSAWGFLPFLVGSVSVSLILTPMFNAARGSILIAELFHFQLNNPLWPDAQPYDMWFFAAAAILTVWLCRGTMFRREGAATVVVPGEDVRATG